MWLSEPPTVERARARRLWITAAMAIIAVLAVIAVISFVVQD